LDCPECFKSERLKSSALWFSSFLFLAVLGCSHQEFSRPYENQPVAAIGDMLDSRQPYIEPTKSASEVRMERLAEVLAQWQAKSGGGSRYSIGPGDVLEVNIFALEAPDKTSALTRTVSQDGYVSLPWAGNIYASGLNTQQLETRIEAAYAGKYIKDPQVTVIITEYRSAAVVVTGAVGKPGVYYLTANKSTVLAVLAEAGGLTPEAGDQVLITRTGASRPAEAGPEKTPAGAESAPGTSDASATAEESSAGKEVDFESASTKGNQKIIALDLKELIDKGNFSLNLEVESGDILTVSPRSAQFVYVLGYVQKPGAFELKNGMRVDTLKAVAMAGGLSYAARAENSFLVRETPEGQKIIHADLTKIARGVRPPIYMEPGDTLVIGSSLLGRLSEFIKPSIGAGFSYAP